VDITEEVNYKDYSKIDVGFVNEIKLKRLSEDKEMSDNQLLNISMKYLMARHLSMGFG
jgi:hypothetical protein